jgi:hypothetical protein
MPGGRWGSGPLPPRSPRPSPLSLPPFGLQEAAARRGRFRRHRIRPPLFDRRARKPPADSRPGRRPGSAAAGRDKAELDDGAGAESQRAVRSGRRPDRAGPGAAGQPWPGRAGLDDGADFGALLELQVLALDVLLLELDLGRRQEGEGRVSMGREGRDGGVGGGEGGGGGGGSGEGG